MQLKRDPRATRHPDLLTADINDSPIAWTGDQHYRAVFKPKGNMETPLLGIYPMGSPCDQSFVGMFELAVKTGKRTSPYLEYNWLVGFNYPLVLLYVITLICVMCIMCSLFTCIPCVK